MRNLHATILIYLFLLLLSGRLEFSKGNLSLNDILLISCGEIICIDSKSYTKTDAVSYKLFYLFCKQLLNHKAEYIKSLYMFSFSQHL